VRLAANSVEQLRSILKQLQQQQGLADSDTKLQVKQCSEDVEAFIAKLAELCISPSDTRGRRIWKHVKAVLNEKDLDRMHLVLTGYSAALGLRLIVLQR
jgi:hypothetical protein